MAKITREKFKTRNNVFDNFTNKNLFTIAGRGLFNEETLSPVKIGKEANIFSALKEDEKEKVIIKIYRLETCDFKKMYEYISLDPRFESLKKKRRDIIFSWTKREYTNLFKAKKANVKVPIPYMQYYNIIVMSFIGNEQPAIQLKDYIFETEEEKEKILKQIIKNYKNLYYKAKLVHGDLSKFNILIHKKKVYFIDFSQSTTINSLNSKELLLRDIKNITNYFKKQNYNITEEELYKKIIEHK